MKCFVCGSGNVIITKTNDLMCAMKIVMLCECDSCGAEWYADTQI